MQRQVPGPMLQLVYCPGLLHVQGHWLFLTGLKMTPIPNALLLMQVWLLLEVRCGFSHMEFCNCFSKLLVLVFLVPDLPGLVLWDCLFIHLILFPVVLMYS